MIRYHRDVAVAGIHSVSLRGICEVVEPAACPVSFFVFSLNRSTVVHELYTNSQAVVEVN